MASLPNLPPNRNGKQQAADYPPVALGRLDDESRWHWLDETDGAFKPDGVLDMVLTMTLCAVACIPFLLFYCPLCWTLRAIMRKVGA